MLENKSEWLLLSNVVRLLRHYNKDYGWNIVNYVTQESERRSVVTVYSRGSLIEFSNRSPFVEETLVGERKNNLRTDKVSLVAWQEQCQDVMRDDLLETKALEKMFEEPLKSVFPEMEFHNKMSISLTWTHSALSSNRQSSLELSSVFTRFWQQWERERERLERDKKRNPGDTMSLDISFTLGVTLLLFHFFSIWRCFLSFLFDSIVVVSPLFDVLASDLTFGIAVFSCVVLSLLQHKEWFQRKGNLWRNQEKQEKLFPFEHRPLHSFRSIRGLTLSMSF